jgi:hypothetical protein
LPDLSAAAPALTAAVLGVGWIAALWYLRVSTPPAVLSWQRLARLRGLADQRPLGERLGGRLPPLERLQQETDIGRLLAVAGDGRTAPIWFLRTAFLAGSSLLCLLLLDELALVGTGRLALPPGMALVASALVAALCYVRLRNRALRTRQVLGRAVADSLPHLAVMTYHHRIPASEALLIFARCQRDRTLDRLLGEEAWRWRAAELGDPLVPAASTAALYERMGRVLGVPMLTALGAAVRRVTERGLSSQEVFTQLAQATYGERLAEARVAAAQAKTLIVIPMGLMILPVLLLIGAPLAVSLLGMFAR